MSQPKNLLLISSNPDDVAFANAIAQSTGMALTVEADPRKAATNLTTSGPMIILADGSPAFAKLVETALADTVGLYSERVSGNSMHWIGSVELTEVTHLYKSPIFGNFICRNYSDPTEAGKRYAKIITAHLAERSFGLQTLLGPAAKVQVVKFDLSSMKQQGVEAVKNYLIQSKFKTRMAVVVANAVDELLMNAMFDAPVDSQNKHLYTNTARDTELKLEGRHQVELQIGFDQGYVGITAVDHFGSLDKVKLFEHISKRYAEEEYKIRASYAGAGIGLATVFRSGGSFLFVSDAGVRTEVTVFFRLTDNFRDFKEQFRFISSQFYF